MDMEKIYKMMGNVGAGNIALGIIMIVTGVTAGVLTIVGMTFNKSLIVFNTR